MTVSRPVASAGGAAVRVGACATGAAAAVVGCGAGGVVAVGAAVVTAAAVTEGSAVGAALAVGAGVGGRRRRRLDGVRKRGARTAEWTVRDVHDTNRARSRARRDRRRCGRIPLLSIRRPPSSSARPSFSSSRNRSRPRASLPRAPIRPQLPKAERRDEWPCAVTVRLSIEPPNSSGARRIIGELIDAFGSRLLRFGELPCAV